MTLPYFRSSDTTSPEVHFQNHSLKTYEPGPRDYQQHVPSHEGHGSLSGQLALLFHRVDTGQHSALALVPLLEAVMESKPDVDIWELVYMLATGRQQDAQSEKFGASYSNMHSESAFQYLVQCMLMAEARAVTAEERRGVVRFGSNVGSIFFRFVLCSPLTGLTSTTYL
ncbi:hypothetical protein FQN54_005287 [Arachnomyces sp. PD_36]|nr:hypothetical protein FQN54_005287 [Arachnomyces sp. PD_36]